MKKVAIINYGLGNLRSVYNAFEYIGASPCIIENSRDLKNADYAILPGVGAFGDGMKYLNENGWVPAIQEFSLERKKPFLGICLGMQLLATKGTEFGDHNGLNLINGTVIRFQSSDKSIRIPHIGWNSIDVVPDKRMYAGIETPLDYYFVHSYYYSSDDTSVISGTCNYGQKFIASLEKDNIWGAQYHPEKSQRAGLSMLRNFLKV